METREIMMIPDLANARRVKIDRVLESAVVLNWSELLQASEKGQVHIEYGMAPEPSLQYVKIWLSTVKGEWDLICQYWMSPGKSGTPAAGITFTEGYRSAALAQMLDQMMQHRDGFANSLCEDSGVKMIQITPPTDKDTQDAGECMTAAYERVGLVFSGKVAAA
jgi:hypothetical protein